MAQTRILYLALSDRLGPTSRYRVYQYQQRLSQAGVEVEIAPALPNTYFEADSSHGLWRKARKAAAAVHGLLRRLCQLAKIPGASLVVIERELFPRLPPIFEAFIRFFGRGFVLEMDDAVYLAPGRRWYYSTTLRLARHVIVGNQVLAEHVRRYNQAVTVVPTTVDLSRYAVKNDYALPSMPRLGWVGLASNFPHLLSIAPALKKICTDFNAQVVVMSARRPDIDVPMEFVVWNEQDEPTLISTFDIGLMPLLDTPFARGKCGLKLLQYMAAGVPSVASPVGVNSSIIDDGKNGRLAATVADWANHLSALLSSAEQRQKMGCAGRATVESRFSLTVGVEQLAALYCGLVQATSALPAERRR